MARRVPSIWPFLVGIAALLHRSRNASWSITQPGFAIQAAQPRINRVGLCSTGGRLTREHAVCQRPQMAARDGTSLIRAAGFAPSPVPYSAQVFGVINIAGLLISLVTGSHLHLDLFGTGAFVVVAALTGGESGRSRLSAACVAVWATRLTAFLFYRALQVRHDARLEQTLSSTGGAVVFWLISFVWGFVTMLPHTLGASASGSGQPSLRLGGLLACGLFAFGLYWEVLADLQKWWFKADPANKGKFCDVGLWSLSQHPNYFGNLCIWVAIFLLNLPALCAVPNGGGRRWARVGKVVAGLLCPVLLYSLFQGQASGAMTNSAQLAMNRYGKDAAYLEYVQNVPLIFPRLPWSR